jgi:UDP-GlcNAc:undecaprenyl-phosphate GlcNAc-1-phosphate transferase
MFFIECIAVFLLSLILIYLVRKHAENWGMIDIPNSRSTHVDHTVRGAGIGFYMATAIVVLLFNHELLFSYPWTFASIFMIFIVGVLDDHNDTSPNTKFIVIMLGTLFLYCDGFIIRDLGIYWGMELSLGWFALPFTIFAVSGFTNALNLIDGLDGLAGTISITILLGFFIIGYTYDDTFIMYLSGTFISALAAFLFYNWHPASIFMGDSGSLTLGFIISLLAIRSLEYLPTISILFIAAIPILDTLVVMIRRKMNSRSIFSADHCHIHHILKQFFAEDTRKTVFFLGIIQATYTFSGLQLAKNTDDGYLLVLFILNVISFYLFLCAMIKRQKRDC